MKVVVFSIVPSPYQRDLFKALSAKVDLKVYYMEPASPDSPWPEKPLECYESILPGIYVSFRGRRFFINWKIPSLKNNDVIIYNGYMGIVFQWLLRFQAKSGKSFFWGERMAHQATGLKGKIQYWLVNPIKNCDAIVAIGTRAETEYRSRFRNIPVVNISYYCNLELFQNCQLKKQPNVLNLLFCGQMIYRKGLDILLQAFEQLSTQYDMGLHLVGREADVNEMLSKLSSETKSKIINHGFQPPEKLPEFFNKTDIFILPSRYDGWGVVVNQALGAGMPVICSDQVGAGLDLIEEGKNGFRFKSGDVNDLTSKIKTFLDRPELIPSMSAYSRKKSFSITPEKGAEKWLQLFNQATQ